MGVLIIWLVTSSLLSYSSAKYDGGCDRCVHRSNVAISDNDFMSKNGTCEYGGDKTEFNTEYPAGARDLIYQKGAGCGTTYQVRCTDKTICDVKGIEVIVTTNASETNADNADFMLSKEAFIELFQKNIKVPKKLLHDGIEVEYKRIPSVYKENQPMSIRVEIMGKNDFAVKLLYQGGQTYIKSIAMAFYKKQKTWHTMQRRNEGTIWEVRKITVKMDWHLKFKFTVTEGFEDKDYETEFVKIDKIRVVYGLGRQLNNIIAKERCKTCDKTNWR